MLPTFLLSIFLNAFFKLILENDMTMIYALEVSTLFFMTWSLIGLELGNNARLAGQISPRLWLSLIFPELRLEISVTPLAYVCTPN